LSNQAGICQVQLGMNIELPDWKGKDVVKDAVFAKIDDIFAFK